MNECIDGAIWWIDKKTDGGNKVDRIIEKLHHSFYGKDCKHVQER